MLANSLARFVELFERRGERYHICRDRVLRAYGPVVRPFGPVVQDAALDPAEARAALRALGGRVLWWADGCAEDKPSEWYAVVCRRFTPLEALSANNRSKLRRGLKHCTVRPVTAVWLAEHGYPVYAGAYTRYTGGARPVWDAAGFASYFRASEGFDDITQYWGAFAGDRLVGFACVNVFEQTEAAYWMIKLDPEALKLYVSYALLHVMNEHYLARAGLEYVNDGWRTVKHETNIQDFLEQNFGFVRAGARLHVVYRWPLGPAVRATFPLRRWLRRLDGRLGALYALEEFRRARPPAAPPPAPAA